MKQGLVMVWIVLCLVVLFCSCSQGYSLKFPETELLKEEVFSTFASVEKMQFRYTKSAKMLSFDIVARDMTEKDACALVRMIRETTMDREFQEKLLEKLEVRMKPLAPEIYVLITDPTWVWYERHYGGSKYKRTTKYSFSSSYYFEVFNSGRDLNEYTYNGYSEWHGTQYFDGYQKSISNEKILSVN